MPASLVEASPSASEASYSSCGKWVKLLGATLIAVGVVSQVVKRAADKRSTHNNKIDSAAH